MSIIRKIWNFIRSMQFAIGLLVVLAAVCALGSFITQGQTYDAYAQLYGERTAGAIMALQLDDVFHAWWFVLLTAFLCVNLILCNLVRIPAILKQQKREGDPASAFGKEGTVCVRGVKDPEGLFHALGFHGIRKTEQGLFAVKNRAGVWGAWVCHLGILLLILGFGLGQATKEQYTVYGLPGDSMQVGETGYILTIDSFDVGLREDDTVEQYTAGITVRNPKEGQEASASISVNNPATLFGMKYYQNSTGWAADIHITKDGEPLQDEPLIAGHFTAVKDKPDLVIFLSAFYPDYVLDPAEGPMSISSVPNNPAYLYSVYYQGQMLGMNALLESEELTIDEYTVTFDNPRNYTLIQVKKDRFTPLALAGGLVVMLGLVLAFYVQGARVWAEEDGVWTVHGESKKGGALFADRVREEAEKFL